MSLTKSDRDSRCGISFDALSEKAFGGECGLHSPPIKLPRAVPEAVTRSKLVPPEAGWTRIYVAQKIPHDYKCCYVIKNTSFHKNKSPCSKWNRDSNANYTVFQTLSLRCRPLIIIDDRFSRACVNQTVFKSTLLILCSFQYVTHANNYL